MKKKLLPFLLVALIAIMAGCVGSDIDDLQNQIDDLNSKVDELEKSQQEALLAQIANLQAAMSALEASLSNDIESGDADLLAQYQAVSANLAILEDEVANNSSAVYYGNLLTDDDFAAFLAQGATIVTGKVIVTKQAHIDALAACKMIGVDLNIEGGSAIELPNLQNVGGNLSVSKVSLADAVVTLPSLVSVGSSLTVMNNTDLASFTADALVLINNALYLGNNTNLTTLSLAGLDVVESVYMNEYNEANYGVGNLMNINLSSTNVTEDVDLNYIGGTLNLGTIGGDLTLSNTSLTEFGIQSETIGNLTIQYNYSLTNLDLGSLVTVEGGINLTGNGQSDGGGISSTTATAGEFNFPAFEALTTINGDVNISSNTCTQIESFNSVTTFTGALIKINGNGGPELIRVFDALVDGGPNSWSKIDIDVYENTAWFNGFNALIEANIVKLAVNGILDQTTWANGPTKIEGFDAMTACKALELNAKDAAEFTAFSVLENFKGYGVTNCLILDMPAATVGMCSMEPILTKIKNGDFDTKNPIFRQNWSEVDKATAIDQLLAPCATN